MPAQGINQLAKTISGCRYADCLIAVLRKLKATRVLRLSPVLIPSTPSTSNLAADSLYWL